MYGFISFPGAIALQTALSHSSFSRMGTTPAAPAPRQARTQRINHDKWPAGCYRAADPADLEDALDGADAPMVKFNDPASGASTAATGNDYELICEIMVAPATSPAP